MELASIITINREQHEVVTNKYQMQDISNMSHRGINPSPSLDTTIQAVADDRTLPPDDTKNDTTVIRLGGSSLPCVKYMDTFKGKDTTRRAQKHSSYFLLSHYFSSYPSITIHTTIPYIH